MTCRRLAATLLAALLVLACTTTRVEEAWQSPDAPPGGFHSIGVIGLAERPEMRSYHEGHFVARLEAAGIRAVGSAEGLPDIDSLGREKVQAWARENEVTAVITTRLVNIEKEVWTTQVDPSSRWDRARPGDAANEVEAASVTYRLETEFYEVSTARLLFRARTESIRPVSPHSVVLSVIGTLVDELTTRGLLTPASP